MLDKFVLVVYTVFVAVGAIMGYLKGSMMSLAMGLGSAFMVLLGLWLLGINARGAWIMLACLSGFLALVFLLRIFKTQVFLPAGLLFIVSIIFLVFSLLRFSKTS